MAAVPTDEICALVDKVYARLRVVVPHVEHATVESLCQRLDVALPDLPAFCHDALVIRFLRASDFDVDETVARFERHYEEDMVTRNPPSNAEKEVLESNRFKYLGQTRDGRPVMCADFKWGEFLHVEGGIETVLKAFRYYVLRVLPAIVERDLGRRSALTFQNPKILYIGGTPPITFSLAAFTWMEYNYPGAREIVKFETSQIRRAMARHCLQFTTRGDVTIKVATSLAQVCELLNIEETVMPAGLLDVDMNQSLEGKLSATAMLDREWGVAAFNACRHGCTNFSELAAFVYSDNYNVKNTFVQVAESATKLNLPGIRDADPSAAEKKLLPHDVRDRALSVEDVQVQLRSVFEIGGVPTEQTISIDVDCKKTRRSKRLCGWTRSRNSKKAAKKLAAASAEVALEARSDSTVISSMAMSASASDHSEDCQHVASVASS